ncbi:uncharacterized protein MONBRDRAFT_26418 [Monosiga brevicollis MX1]|uniref:Calpain catalytic domain-containing protein n=1 Tax=Monosiga brevicollis TaxID=81824 RepID=A9V2B3_MONBE|nr:uncharacterized protein MONBRDRAFT_26418 [Monosiga brevicollis MX1]EDQ88345.1 predicted protein [Monosiga brevicollis MX1]|eukprot:XP_001746938.1 hypothetical protein [Monosiga brevicollis MX1]
MRAVKLRMKIMLRCTGPTLCRPYYLCRRVNDPEANATYTATERALDDKRAWRHIKDVFPQVPVYISAFSSQISRALRLYSDFTTCQTALFGPEGPHTSQVKQGALGNCWFVSALAVIASKPALIKRIVDESDYDAATDTYSVRLWYNGNSDRVPITPTFPVAGGSLCYARSVATGATQTGYAWAPLIEKAMTRLTARWQATMFGSYRDLDSGVIAEGFSCLTGFPCESYRLRMYAAQPSEHSVSSEEEGQNVMEEQAASSNRATPSPNPGGPGASAPAGAGSGDDNRQDMLWLRLSSYHDAGYVMGASIADRGNEEVADPAVARGLEVAYVRRFVKARLCALHSLMHPLARHAYSIVAVETFLVATQAGPAQLQLLCIHNPLGASQWNGLYRDADPMWRRPGLAKVREQCQPNRQGQGFFWMSYQDFLRYFHNVDVCKVLLDLYEIRREGLFTHNPCSYHCAYVVEPAQEITRFEIGLVQSSLRGRQNNDIPQDMCVIIVELDREHELKDFVNGSLFIASRPKVAVVHSPTSSQVRMLKPTCRYVVLPISFNGYARSSPRPLTAAFFANGDMTVRMHELAPRDVGWALATTCRQRGECSNRNTESFRNGMAVYKYGTWFAAENRALEDFFRVRIEVEESSNYVSSRHAEILMVEATLPPITMQFLVAYSNMVAEQAARIDFRFTFGVVNSMGLSLPAFAHPRQSSIHHPLRIPAGRGDDVNLPMTSPPLCAFGKAQLHAVTLSLSLCFFLCLFSLSVTHTLSFFLSLALSLSRSRSLSNSRR